MSLFPPPLLFTQLGGLWDAQHGWRDVHAGEGRVPPLGYLVQQLQVWPYDVRQARPHGESFCSICPFICLCCVSFPSNPSLIPPLLLWWTHQNILDKFWICFGHFHSDRCSVHVWMRLWDSYYRKQKLHYLCPTTNMFWCKYPHQYSVTNLFLRPL